MDEPLFPPLTEGAVALHENMLAFISAGFTREESLKIVIAMLTEAIRKGDPPAKRGEG